MPILPKMMYSFIVITIKKNYIIYINKKIWKPKESQRADEILRKIGNLQALYFLTLLTTEA
jgi:hypothetical protein